MPPEGSSEITTSIGGRCKVREGFSRPVLISREAWPVITTRSLHCVCPRLILRLSKQFGVATAEGSHLFPFRTEKLSPPAPMVLPGRPGGRVGRRPINISSPTALVLAHRSRFALWLAGGSRCTACLRRACPSRSGAVRSGAASVATAGRGVGVRV
jgi:hypothetical protein